MSVAPAFTVQSKMCRSEQSKKNCKQSLETVTRQEGGGAAGAPSSIPRTGACQADFYRGAISPCDAFSEECAEGGQGRSPHPLVPLRQNTSLTACTRNSSARTAVQNGEHWKVVGDRSGAEPGLVLQETPGLIPRSWLLVLRKLSRPALESCCQPELTTLG